MNLAKHLYPDRIPDHMPRKQRHLSEQLHSILLRDFGLKSPDFSHERVARAMTALNALDLCHKAGFDLKRCLQFLDILSWYMLDFHDLDGVYGTDEEIELDPDQATSSIGRISIEWRLWRARHRRSHPSIHERRQILLARIADMERNNPLITEVKPAPAAPEKHTVGVDAALRGLIDALRNFCRDINRSRYSLPPSAEVGQFDAVRRSKRKV